MASTARLRALLPLLAAMALGAVLAWWASPGQRSGAGLSGASGEVALLEGQVAELRAALRRAEVASGAPPLAAAPPPAVDPRVGRLEAELAAAKAQLQAALQREQAAASSPSQSALVGGPGAPDSARPTIEWLPGVPGRQVVTDPELDLPEAERLLDSAREEDRQEAYARLARTGDRRALPLLQRVLADAAAGSLVPALIQRAASLKDRPWSALQATGAPDTPIGGDLGTAWAPKSQQMGEVTLDLEYERAVRVDRIRVHETLNPGAVARIYALDPAGSWELLWEGVATPSPAPHWFAPVLRSTSYATRHLRLVLDTERVEGWNEIDAVELGADDGRTQWASGALASSSYADAS